MSIHECKIDSALNKIFKKKDTSVPLSTHNNDLLKNSSYDFRGDIKPSSNVNIGPWNISTINPDSLEATEELFKDSNNDSQNMPLDNLGIYMLEQKIEAEKKAKFEQFQKDYHTNTSHLKFFPPLIGGTFVGTPAKSCYEDIIEKTLMFYDVLFKSTFDLKNLEEIILLNQEDDTVIPVIKISDELLNIIKTWYEMSDLIFDMEETHIKIPQNINKKELNNILFKPVPVSAKDNLVKNFLPKFMFKLTLEQTLNNTHTDSGIFLQNNLQTNKKTLGDLGLTKLIFNKITSKNDYDMSEIFNHANIIQEKNKVEDDEDDEEYNSNQVQAANYYDVQGAYINEKNQEDDLNMSSLTVILNYYNLNTIVIDNINSQENEIIERYTEYGFIKLFDIETNNELVKTFILNTFNANFFNNKEEINKLLKVTQDFVGIYNKLDKENSKVYDEQLQIRNYLEANFIIDDNIENRIKFTDLCSLIENSPCINISKTKLRGLKNRLSGYLKNLGLQKKRYNDGYYYYGIKTKYSNERPVDTLLNECKIERLHLEKKEDTINQELLDKFNECINIRTQQDNKKYQPFGGDIRYIPSKPFNLSGYNDVTEIIKNKTETIKKINNEKENNSNIIKKYLSIIKEELSNSTLYQNNTTKLDTNTDNNNTNTNTNTDKTDTNTDTNTDNNKTDTNNDNNNTNTNTDTNNNGTPDFIKYCGTTGLVTNFVDLNTNNIETDNLLV